MKKVIFEKVQTINGPKYLFRFMAISAIQNDTKRRVALILTFPIFFIFNCLAVFPMIALSFVLNNVSLVETMLLRWNVELGEAELWEIKKSMYRR